ncbi:hypothetical protein FB567DRAFT_513615 [Paraphoma chrysanthemicola]|uniref:Uncharacterized protein n=1 Tax=Paraphoma chrysanthemicola TaxID=798071 RepID=A0A8K0RJX8_9PLEO|nr:hypothetical protein FB567DRAFT_513615 [Paraphoma chrysanthemicola]
MLHKWTNDCSSIKDETDKTADQDQRKTILSFRLREEPSILPRTYPLRVPPSLSKLRLPQHITIWLPNLHILKQDKGKQAAKAEVDESAKEWHIDFDYNDTLGDTRYIYHRTPKKLRTPLEPDKSGQSPPTGWGIWIEEDFVFPWYLPLLLMALVIGMLIFSAWYSHTQSPKASAWPIGGYVLAAVALPVTGWMTWAKDSKHARI